MNIQHSVKKPPFLKRGERIHLCAPSYPPSLQRFEQAKHWLEQAGYLVTWAPESLRAHGYLAGTDDERAEALNWAFAQKEIRAIFALRGGYGAMRILDRLDFDALSLYPKILLGYSDFSAILLAAYTKSGLVGFHGPMPAVELVGSQADWVYRGFLQANEPLPLGPMPMPEAKILRPGQGSGVLLGGCLSLLAHLCGTPYFPNLEGSVLFWEEIGEPPYRIDRMLTQLRLAGHLDKLAAMVVGGLTDCGPHNDQPFLPIEQILSEVLDGTTFPIVMGAPFGHISQSVTLPVGCRSSVWADGVSGSVVWSIDESATQPRPDLIS